MSRLVAFIAKAIRDTVRSEARTLGGSSPELRVLFHGPPLEFLEPVFEELMRDGGIDVVLQNGQEAVLPVLLQLQALPSGAANPDVGKSGPCDQDHLLTLRNAGDQCPRFVALVPPGQQRMLSLSSASSEFGVAAENNAGNASIDQWWKDGFIQEILEEALDGLPWPRAGQKEQALNMIERAVESADELGRHEVSRVRAWRVLARVWAARACHMASAEAISLACGFPPSSRGLLMADEQARTLDLVADELVDDGFRPAIERMAQDAVEAERVALREFLHHLEARCDLPPAFARAPCAFYAPEEGSTLGAAPTWWETLTVERWAELLEEEHPPEGALGIECANSIIPRCRGINGLVLGTAEIVVTCPDDGSGQITAVVTRETGRATQKVQWTKDVPSADALRDSDIPAHRAPVRYTAEAPALRKATLKIVSLGSWEPGVFVFCRTATKLTAPRKAKQNREGVTLESTLLLTGQGRHFVDVYVRNGVTVASEASGRDASDGDSGVLHARVNPVSDYAYGLEIEATAECYYDITAIDTNGDIHILRVYITCDETTAEGCKSEFERLIRLNRQQSGRATTDVHIDRQARCSDLETWTIAAQNVERSYYPLVLATDYAQSWRPPSWSDQAETILSSARYLHDPRPAVSEMVPPAEYLDARIALATAIRGEGDESGLFESAPLGVRIAGDPEFAELIDKYLRAYLAWLDADPEVAVWADLLVISEIEADGRTLVQEPNAVLVSPLHPLRVAWHSIAQRALYAAYHRNMPCPAASVLDPDSVPDVITIPLRTPAGGYRRQAFISVECSSDYWSILWNASRLDRLGARAGQPPFDVEFGVQLGGVSSGFSVSQVQRALDDVSGMFPAKPVLNVLVSSAAGQNNACNEGLVAWCRGALGVNGPSTAGVRAAGPRVIQIFDDRKSNGRPEAAIISNLGEDTDNAVRWFEGLPARVRPDLGIIAQLETSNPQSEQTEIGTPLGPGALLRHRIRRQLKAGEGAFLSESRTGEPRAVSGDGLVDRVLAGVIRLENLGADRVAHTFAPNVHAIQDIIADRRAVFAAVSSAAVDPACFLGEWLKDAYLWDYDLPSYSHRAGDTNGYYLLSQVKDSDTDSLRESVARLPGCGDMSNEALQEVILEVARRGIPTLRGLAGGDTGAAGDLGMFVAARLLQDEFRRTPKSSSLVSVLHEAGGEVHLALVIPVDPFRGYLEDMQRALGVAQSLRPDMLVCGIFMTESRVRCVFTPVEVKYRQGEGMSAEACTEALGQARALSDLFLALNQRASDPDLLLWKLGFQHLLLSLLGFGFRVYSQQGVAAQNALEWTKYHQRVAAAIIADECEIEIDPRGRLIVIERALVSGPKDIDGDGFSETVSIALKDAATIIGGDPTQLYGTIRSAIGTWKLMPTGAPEVPRIVATGEGRIEKPSAVRQGEGRVDPATLTAPRGGFGEEGNPTITETAPPDSGGVSIFVGWRGGFSREEVRLNLSDTRLNQLNIGVVGDLGTGKTQLLKSIIKQVGQSASANQGHQPKMLVLDYKNDYGAASFVEAVGARVVKPYKLPVNLFDSSGVAGAVAPWLDRFKFFADVLDKIYPGIGPVQRQNLKQAVRQAYDRSVGQGRQPTIYDVHSQYRQMMGPKVDAILAIIDDLVDAEMFSSDPAAAAGFGEFLNGITVIDLSALGQDDRTKNMLVAIMLNMFYERMLRITKRPYIGSNPQLRVIDSFIMIDEADNIMRYEFDVLRKVLLEGREFGVGVILASQFLRHFKAGSTDYRAPLLTWFIHKVPNIVPQELGALGMTQELGELSAKIKSLEMHYCLYKSRDDSGELIKGLPFYELMARH